MLFKELTLSRRGHTVCIITSAKSVTWTYS